MISRLAPLVFVCCGGASAIGADDALAPTPPPGTTAALAGPLCAGDTCRCRDLAAPGDGGAGEPAAGTKRFEVRLGPSQHAQWVNLDEGVLHQSAERTEACFYVDLTPGEHTLRLRASREGGASAVLRVREFGAAAASWYDTFTFSCGEGGVCDADGLAAERARFSSVKDGKHDPCGGTLVRGLSWQTSKLGPGEPPAEIQADLTLAVYAFSPPHPHGDPACAGE